MSVSNVSVYGELWRYPLYINRFVKIFKFWFKVLNSNNCVIKNVYKELLNDAIHGKKNWAYKLKVLLENYGYGYLWEIQDSIIDGNSLIPCFKQRVIDCFLQEWRSDIGSKPVLLVYKHIKENFEYEPYLDLLNISQRLFITRMRTSAHCLRIETLRNGNNRIDREFRLCQICENGEIEDEYHFMLKCARYRVIRKRYINAYFTLRPSMFKLIELLRSVNHKTMTNLVMFIKCALKIRENMLRQSDLS